MDQLTGSVISRSIGMDKASDHRVSEKNQCSAVARPNPRRLIEERIDYHNRMANGLCALLRSIPQEIPFPADDALASIILGSRPKW